ncbi:MAG: UbiA family prenyltransferase [Ginsengibacter sp.]
MHLPLNKPGFYFFVFGGVMVQYNIHYIVKKNSYAESSRLKWSKKNRGTHSLLIIAGLVLLITGLFCFKRSDFIFLLIPGIITLMYSLPLLPLANKKRLKDFGILKIITLVMIWTVITVWLPVHEFSYTDKSFFLIFIRRFIFLFALCLVFDIRDIEIDTKENIRTIPIIIGIKKTHILDYILLCVFILLTIIQYLQTPGIGHLNAMIVSAAATFFMIEYIKKNKSDIAYLACIDGMMLLQALLVIIGSI